MKQQVHFDAAWEEYVKWGEKRDQKSNSALASASLSHALKNERTTGAFDYAQAIT